MTLQQMVYFVSASRHGNISRQFDYEGCREGYRNSVHRLRKEKVIVAGRNSCHFLPDVEK